MDADTLDIEQRAACERYLIAAGHAHPGELVEHRPLAGGVSSRTVLVAFSDGRRWVLKQALAKLRVAADWFSDPSRVHREALGMRVLGELAPPGSIPKLIFDDETHHVLGMEAVAEPHENWKSMLLAGDVSEKLAKQFGDLLGTIHRESWRHRKHISYLFDDRTFFETLRIEPYYEYSAGQEPRAAQFLRRLIEETRSELLALVHGDFSPKNVLIQNHRLILLDHEVIHWGDPAFDVGFAISHFIGKGMAALSDESFFGGESGQVTVRAPNAARLVYPFWNHYRAAVTDVDWLSGYESRCVRHALACLLARAVGRSTFEYLNPERRKRQQEAVVHLMSRSINDVIDIPQAYFLELHYLPE